MLQWCKALLLLPFLAFGQEVIRVAVIWETNEFSYADSMYKSSFMDGFHFFNEHLKTKTWMGQLGGDQEYTLDMHTFDSEFDSDKIRVDFKDLIENGKDAAGNVVGDYHFIIAATAKKNKDIMWLGEQLQIPNIHASGGNPAMWWEHYEGNDNTNPTPHSDPVTGVPMTYAFGMHLPFIYYTKPIIKAAADSGYKTVAILRPHGNFFQQVSSVAAVKWAQHYGLTIIGPSKNWCQQYAATNTQTCRLVDDAGVDDPNGNNCRCIEDSEPQALFKANPNVDYDPKMVPTVYEIDEKTVVDPASMPDNSKNNVYQEFVDVYKGVWDDVAAQAQAGVTLADGSVYTSDFVDVIVHWPIQYKSSLKALKNDDHKPKFFLGWNGGVSPNWAESKFYDVEAGALTEEQALDWHDGVHAFGFGQWFKTLTYNDPFFGTNVAGILDIWTSVMNQGYGYDEFGACTTGVVLYLAVQNNLLKSNFVGATLQQQRDALRVAVKATEGETLWGYVQWNMYQQNTGGGVSSTVSWQVQPQGADWDTMPGSSVLVIPEAFAEGPYVDRFATWEQRDGCSSVGPTSPWVVEQGPTYLASGGTTGFDEMVCRSCDNYGTDQTPASPGLFVANDGSNACELDICPAGNFETREQNLCTPCPPGQANDLENQSQCTQCPKGFYTPTSGQSTCTACAAEISTTARAGGSECMCSAGYFGPYGDGAACQKCPKHQTSKEGALTVSECMCVPGSYPTVDNDGNIIFDEEGAVTCITDFCKSPIVGGEETFESSLDCLGNDGDFSVKPTVAQGYFVAEDVDILVSPVPTVLGNPSRMAVWQCREESFCKGGDNVADQCGPHRTGVGCMWCEKDYRMETSGANECVKCDGVSTFIFAAFIVFVFIVIPLMLRPFVNMSVLKGSPSIVIGLTAMSIVFFNVMALSSLGAYSLKWIEPLKSVIAIADIIQLDLNVIQIQCVVSHTSPVAAYVVQVMGPTIILALIAGLAIGAFVAKGKAIDWPVVVNLMGMLFSFFFVAIAVLSFYPWRCGVKHPFGESALDRQPDVVCSFAEPFGETYTPLVGLSIFGMLLYVVAYLSFIVWAVFKHQSMVIGQNQTFIRSTRFLFFRWKNHCYYWTIFWHARALFVALVPIINTQSASGESSGKILQVVLLISLMAAWLGQVSQTNPWRYPRLNQLDRVCTFLFILMSMAASAASLDPDSANEVVWFVALVLIVMLVAVVFFVGREVYLGMTAGSRPKADFFLSFHRGSAAIQARAVKFTLEYHSGASVILSTDAMDISDSMENSRACKNVVVVWTDASASCMNTAVEVSSSMANKQKIVVLECDSLTASLEQERLVQLENEWTQEATEQFTALLLQPEQITQAYMQLKDVPCIPYNTTGGSRDREDAVMALLENCQSKNLKVPHLSTLAEGVDLFIIHDHTNSQANASAFVLKNAMRSLSFAVATSSDYANEKFPSAILGRVQYAVVLLQNNALPNAKFNASVLALDDACKITPVTIGHDFNVPSEDKLHAMEKGDFSFDQSAVSSILQKDSINSKAVVDRYRAMCRSQTLSFSPSASTEILNAEIGNIFQRVKSGKRGTTIQSILVK